MSQIKDCVEIINQHIENFQPKVGLVLGSGLGQFCDNIKMKASINFKDLPIELWEVKRFENETVSFEQIHDRMSKSKQMNVFIFSGKSKSLLVM